MIQTCIAFDGNCDEAIAFYSNALGATVKEIAYFKDAPPNAAAEDPWLSEHGGEFPPNFVMHSELEVDGQVFVMTDGAENPIGNDNITFLIRRDSPEDATRIFNVLAEGGEVTQPLAPAFWAPLHGQVRDRYGILWGVMVEPAQP